MLKRKYKDKDELTIHETIDFSEGIGRSTVLNYVKLHLLSRRKVVRVCSIKKNLRQRYLYLKSDLVKLLEG